LLFFCCVETAMSEAEAGHRVTCMIT